MALSAFAGTFTKNTGTGAQAVTGVGFLPKILILWTAYKTAADAVSSDYSYSWGMTTGASESYSASFSSQGGVGTSNNSKRGAAKALTVVQYGETTLAEADLTSFDADGFTLDWTTNSGGAQLIHFLALGGTDITGQKVLTFSTPVGTGNHAVTGVGFVPDAVILARHGPFTVPVTIPNSTQNQEHTFSFISGFAQHAMGVSADDGINTAAADYNLARVIKTDLASVAVNSSASLVEQATLLSLDTDGFTLNYTAVNGLPTLVGALALKGVAVKVGNFASASAVTGVGFTPVAVLFAGVQRSTTAAAFTLQYGFGATTGATAGLNQSATVTDTRILAGGGNTQASGADSVTKCITRLSTGPDAIQTQAVLASFDSDGFTLSWSAGAPTDLIAYMALGSLPPGGFLDSGEEG